MSTLAYLHIEKPAALITVAKPVVRLLRIGTPGPPGPAGAGGNGLLTHSFAWGDATPSTVVTVLANKRVYRVRLIIEVAFNGVGAALAVGRAGNLEELLPYGYNDPTLPAFYETHPDQQYGSATPILLTIIPGAGASTGTGQLQLEIEP